MRTRPDGDTEEGCPFPPPLPHARLPFRKGSISYELIRKLGGSDGEPERSIAWRRDLEGRAEPVVITALYSSSTPHERLRVFEEAMNARWLRHPVICRLYELVKHEEKLYAVTEYVEGISLEKLLRLASRRRRRVTAAFACHVAAELADALDYAQDSERMKKGTTFMFHRELTPRSIRLDRFGHVKLVGFGLTFRGEPAPQGFPLSQGFPLPRPADGRLAELGSRLARWAARVLGAATRWVRARRWWARPTPGPMAYLPPGRGADLPMDARLDLRSVGVVFLEMLEGHRRPGRSRYSQRRLRKLLRRSMPGAPEGLANLLGQVLHLGPSWSAPSSGELRDQLQEYLRRQEPSYGDREAAAELFRLAAGVEGLL